MPDKERLIELIVKLGCEEYGGNAMCDGDCFERCKDCKIKITVEDLAERLIENGVIVPPCKVGDTVYVICNKMVQETTVFSMKVETEDKNYVFYIKALAVDGMNKTVHGYATVFKIFVFGKTAFLTRDEAEKALAERSKTDA